MGVTGNLKDMTLTSLISVNCNEGNQASLRLWRGDQEGYIYFDQGQIAHITLDGLEGEEVIRELLAWEDGEFELEMDVEPPARTIQTPWSNLVLDSMRLLDEGEAELEDLELPEFEENNFLSELQEVNTMASLKDLLKEMSADIPGFLAAGVSGMDGLSIAEYSASPDFNMEIASAQFALVMKLVQRSTKQLKGGSVEDNLVTTDISYILARFLGDGSYYLVVAVDRNMASLGNVRLMTRNFASDLWDAIPRRE